MRIFRCGCRIGVSVVLFSSSAGADHPAVAFGINGAGPINTFSADTLPAGALAMGLQTEILNNDAFSDEQLQGFADRGLIGVHSVDQIRNTSVFLSYGITDDLSISARLPYIERKGIREAEHGDDHHDDEPDAHEHEVGGSHGDPSALGDLLVLGQYRAWESGAEAFSFNVGVRMPTGETNDRDGAVGRYEAEFQSGSGSWDMLFGIAASKRSAPFGYHASLLYNLTTEGAQATETGDAISYNTAITYSLRREQHDGHDHSHDDGIAWDLMLELNGENRGRNKVSGAPEQHSGGNAILLAPGLRASSGKVGGYVSLGLPLITSQNGKQTDVSTRVVAGAAVTF